MHMVRISKPDSINRVAYRSVNDSIFPVWDAHSNTTFGRARAMRTEDSTVVAAIGAANVGTTDSARLNSPARTPSSQSRVAGAMGAPGGNVGTPPAARPSFERRPLMKPPK